MCTLVRTVVLEMEAVETQPERFRTFFDPLIRNVDSFGLTESTQRVMGIAILDKLGRPLFGFGVLEGAFVTNETGKVVTALLNSGNSSRADRGLSLEIGGQRFILWKHETMVRVYGTSSEGNWNLAIRALEIGFVVIVHARSLVPALFIPVFENFCDDAARR